MSENKKKTKGFVETPTILVEIMHKRLNLKPNEKLADFTAGRGKLFLNHNKKNCFGIELDEENFAVLKNAGFENIIFGDFFENIDKMPEVDKLILNPPYDRKIQNKIIFESLKKLKNGGRFAIIGSYNLFRTFGDEFFTKITFENNFSLNIELAWELDTNLFKPFAQVKTLLIFGVKGQKQKNFEIQVFSNQEIIVNTRAKIIEPKILAPKKIKTGEKNFWEVLNEPEIIDITPTYEDFKKTVCDYLAFEFGVPVEWLYNPEKYHTFQKKLKEKQIELFGKIL